jgi:UDP-glucose 4-epimerase
MSVYGQSEGFLIDEYSELKGIDPFGKSKIQAERLLTRLMYKT